MQKVPDWHWVVWNNGVFAGPNRPVTRAIIQRGVLSSTARYTGESTLPWRSLLFNTNRDIPWKEIPNIVTCTIDRRLESDAATMSLTFRNQIPVDPNANLDLSHGENTIGPSRRDLKDVGFPGYFSYNRGTTPYSVSRWGHPIDPEWMDEFIPNRVVITFQGYGTDGAVEPWKDENLVQTGIWLIDRVEYRGGLITLECRDMAKLLIEQRLYPPIVPLDKYPLVLQSDHTVKVLQERVEVPGGETTNLASFPNYDFNSSNAYQYGDKRYGGPCGHGPEYAWELAGGDISTFWLSAAWGTPNGFEWIEGRVANPGDNRWVRRIKFYQKWGGYQVYVSIFRDGAWVGDNIIPGPASNGSNIPYVEGPYSTPYGDGWVTIELQFHYDTEKFRLTFTNLYRTDYCNDSTHTTPHRVGIAAIQATAINTEITVVEEVDQFVPGNIRDYTEIVKLLTAWSGWYWPEGSPTDWVIANWSNQQGRVWGDFEYSGAYPVDPPVIDPSFWDNKSVMDGINQIKEILGFIFYIDSTGGVVWRSPNIWSLGNFITGEGYKKGEGYVEVVDEDRVLLDYGVTLDDTSLRSEVVVVAASSPDENTTVQPGWAVFRPGGSAAETVPEAGTMNDLRLLGGQERVMIVPDYPFLSQDEIRKFGYLVTLWMHWSFRKSRFRIPGIAAFEPDDQIRIFERTTSETFVHYITGVSSVMDMDNGTWHLDIDTHWLGEGPGAAWVVDYQDIASSSPALYAFLVATGRIDTESAGSGIGDDFFQMPEIKLPDGNDIYNDLREFEKLVDELFPALPPVSLPDPALDTESVNESTGSTTSPQAGSYAWTTTYWGARCTSLASTKFTLLTTGAFPGQTASITVPLNGLAEKYGVWKALRIVLLDLEIPIVRVAGYSCRKIAGSTKWSNHSWGIAIDINPWLNSGWGVYENPSTAPSPDPDCLAMATAIKSRIRLSGGKFVFRWGGDWTSKKDYMHFELIVTPDELREQGVEVDGVPVTPDSSYHQPI